MPRCYIRPEGTFFLVYLRVLNEFAKPLARLYFSQVGDSNLLHTQKSHSSTLIDVQRFQERSLGLGRWSGA